MLKKIITGCLILCVWLTLWFVLQSAPAFRFLELKCLDWQFRLRGERSPSPDILLIGIDENTFHRLQLKYPFPPLVYGELIKQLNQAGAMIVAFDLLYSEPTRECNPPDQDQAVAKLIADEGNVVWGSELEQGERFIPPIKVIHESLVQTGFLNFPDEMDNRIRRFKVRQNGHYSFAAAILKAYAGFVPEHWERDELYLIDYCGPVDTFSRISMADILSGAFTPDDVQNKVCLVGPTFLASHDFYATPFHDPSKPDMPGVEIHAQVLNTLLSGKMFSFKVSNWAYALFVSLLLTAGLALILGYFWGASLLSLIALLSWVIFSIYQFQQYTVTPLAVPLIMGIGLYLSVGILSYLAERRERKQIRTMFSSYVDPTVVNYLLKNPEAVNTAGEKIRATILYSDIKGFSDISSQLPPEKLVSQLNEYFEALTRLVIHHGGMYDKYVGDALMAIFGFPLSLDDQCQRAVTAALEIQQTLQKMNTDWKTQQRPAFQTRIGISTGEVIIGSVGGTQRKDFTAYGNVVNTAARLEALNKQTNTAILIDEETAHNVSESIQIQKLGKYSLKGIHQEVTVYEPIRAQNKKHT